MCRSTARSSVVIWPSSCHCARLIPFSTSARISMPSAFSRNNPVGPMNLSAFHSMGLWLAEMTTPASARMDEVMKAMPGVGSGPTSITLAPMEQMPAAIDWLGEQLAPYRGR